MVKHVQLSCCFDVIKNWILVYLWICEFFIWSHCFCFPFETCKTLHYKFGPFFFRKYDTMYLDATNFRIPFSGFFFVHLICESLNHFF